MVDVVEKACPNCGYRADATDYELKLPLRYRRVYRFMLANLGDETLCVKDLANVAHVSERALQLTWRKYVGESPATHIRRLRLERIRHDLVSSMRDVADIAKSWGMPSRGALNVAFRQAYGVSPMQVRRP